VRLKLTDVATVAGTALALWGVGIIILLLATAGFQARYIRSSLSVDVFLKDKCPQDTVEALKNFVKAKGWVKEVKYISKDEAKEDYIKLTGDDFTEIIEENPLPQSVRLFLKPEFVDNAQMALIERDIDRRFGLYILEIVRKRELVQAINRNIFRLSLILSVFATIQLLVMLTLMSNSIRLAVYASRLTIKTMQLVGARPGFIRRPYLRKAFLSGLFSGMVASMFLTFLIWQFRTFFPDVWAITPVYIFVGVLALIFILGPTISVVAAWQIVNRLLRSEVGLLY